MSNFNEVLTFWGDEPDRGVFSDCIFFTDRKDYDIIDGKPHCFHVDDEHRDRCRNVLLWLRRRGLGWSNWSPELREEYLATHKS